MAATFENKKISLHNSIAVKVLSFAEKYFKKFIWNFRIGGYTFATVL